MKKIIDIISENNVWRWGKKRLSDETLDKYMYNIRDWAKSHYGDSSGNTLLQIYKDNYKDYLSASYAEDQVVDDNKIFKQYKKQCEYAERIVNKYGWSQFENSGLEQGWVDYMNWKIQQNI